MTLPLSPEVRAPPPPNGREYPPPAQPFSPDVGTPPENGLFSEPFSPDVGTPPENGLFLLPSGPEPCGPSATRLQNTRHPPGIHPNVHGRQTAPSQPRGVPR
jgi:hypothetical protein